jgi:hypothetical protein
MRVADGGANSFARKRNNPHTGGHQERFDESTFHRRERAAAPELVWEGVAANDRIKYSLTLLEAIHAP